MKRSKGRLLKNSRSTLYFTVAKNGSKNSMRMVLSQDSKFMPGDRVYQEELPNGSMLLVPEKLFNETIDNN